jgi:hypothetical protein
MVRLVPSVHGLADFNIMKMDILLKAIHRFSEVAIKIPMSFFKEIEKSS